MNSGQNVTSAQPEAVVPEVLEKCARLLGLFAIVPEASKYRIAFDAEGARASRHVWPLWSDGDLLLAILNKAAEMGTNLSLSFWPNTKCWAAGEVGKRQVATTPLEAALLAFAELERP